MRAPPGPGPRVSRRREHRGGNIADAGLWGRRWMDRVSAGAKRGWKTRGRHLLAPSPLPRGWALLPKVTSDQVAVPSAWPSSLCSSPESSPLQVSPKVTRVLCRPPPTPSSASPGPTPLEAGLLPHIPEPPPAPARGTRTPVWGWEAGASGSRAGSPPGLGAAGGRLSSPSSRSPYRPLAGGLPVTA